MKAMHRASTLLCAGVILVLGQTSSFAADLPSKATAPVVPASVGPLFFFSDTVLEYRFESSATDPGASVKFPKQIANITHVDAWTYGTNFVSADVLKSTGADPAAPALNPFQGEGSVELYALYRGTLSGNAISHSKAFSFGPIKDIALGYGGDIETQNTAFAPEKRVLVVGPNISFDVPGYLTFQANLYKEWNHNALAQQFGLPSNANFSATSGRVSFDPTVEFELTYLQPLTFTGLPLTFSGFTNVVLPKGENGFGDKTRAELLSENRLTLDASSYFGHPKLVDVFVGYKLWLNKFGDNDQFGSPTYVPGSHESQFFAGAAVHLQ